MREVVQKVYKFEELERKVQEEVLERYRYVWVDSLDWGEYTEEDFTYNVFSDHGFEVDKDGVSFSLGDAEAGAGFTGAFKDVPPMFLDCIDNEELGNKLMDGDTLYLLETGADGLTEHIHKYKSGCYYECDNRILYEIDK